MRKCDRDRPRPHANRTYNASVKPGHYPQDGGVRQQAAGAFRRLDCGGTAPSDSRRCAIGSCWCGRQLGHQRVSPASPGSAPGLGVFGTLWRIGLVARGCARRGRALSATNPRHFGATFNEQSFRRRGGRSWPAIIGVRPAWRRRDSPGLRMGNAAVASAGHPLIGYSPSSRQQIREPVTASSLDRLPSPNRL